ncbi:MAG: Cna B-type domain-containing protein [Firmicutes bacterium]|nr:Cna B-type domain-containing protein [Bacillota bacterium]
MVTRFTMKKILQRLTTLLLAAALCIGMASTALADTTTITYKGKAAGGLGFLIPTSDYTNEYTESDLFDNFKNVMPGDELQQTVIVNNQSNSSVKLFMRAQVDEPTYDRDLADAEGKQSETAATMADFLSRLSMKVYNGDRLIYGDTEAEDNWVSADQLDGLRENKLLGNIAANQSIELTVYLRVPGELDNSYANRVVEVDWVFSIEETGGGGDDNTVSRTVYKVWQDSDESKRPESITVTLVGTDRETGRVVEEKNATLNAENQWTCSWTGLDSVYQWDVKEINVPDGYTAGYERSQSGRVITIINSDGGGGNPGGSTPGGDTPGTDTPDGPVFTADLTVIKAWDDDNATNRPNTVTLQLYNGAAAVDTVTLSAAGGWTYTWEDLAADGEWRVIEVDIPDGYTPVYSMADGVITITNTESLIDAGQMNWPVPVLGGLGVLVLVSGIVLMRRKNDHAAE